jgi:hypothetical protein
MIPYQQCLLIKHVQTVKMLSVSFDMFIHLDNQVISICITLNLLAVTKNKELGYCN